MINYLVQSFQRKKKKKGGKLSTKPKQCSTFDRECKILFSTVVPNNPNNKLIKILRFKAD